MSSAMSLERSRSSNPAEPSRFIYISGLRNPRPLNELRHWFSRGRHIYDELRVPVVPCSMGGAGPDRLATSTSSGHPAWESTLPDHDAEELSFAEEHLQKQVAEIEAAEALVGLEEAEKAKAEQEEERLDEAEKKKKEIRANTWKGSRGKYGNEADAKLHAFLGRAGTPGHQQQQQQAGMSRPLPAFLPSPAAGLEYQAPQSFLDPAIGYGAFPPSSPSPIQGFNHLTSAHPFPTAVASDAAVFNHNGLCTFSQQQQQGPRTPPQHRPAPLHLNNNSGPDNNNNNNNNPPAWWIQPAATLAMSVLSPRAVSFVPAGLFSPEPHHVVPRRLAPAPVIANGRPQQQQPYFHGHRSRPSNLNPMAGDFRPGAMAPVGPRRLQRGGGEEK